ncbi:MAG: hypothetical protein A2718_01215 [Candidatus Ryanbacteria bacterium RIFCSPHIGHO2_01_FULL_44_130]|nr:MAG: hypothetical protein A2718_01215 [Candidatus Ryanbacteria bacterium RIFCSPHIGHO2_01_FULL_44_130]
MRQRFAVLGLTIVKHIIQNLYLKRINILWYLIVNVLSKYNRDYLTFSETVAGVLGFSMYLDLLISFIHTSP